MKKSTTIISIFALSVIALLTACGGGGGGGNNSDPNRGYFVQAFAVNSAGIRFQTIARVEANLLQTNGQTIGTQSSFDQNVLGAGLTRFQGAIVPGRWSFRVSRGLNGASLCAFGITQTTELNLSPEEVAQINCPATFLTFEASPNLIDAFNLPATLTFTGEKIDAAYGNPALAVYNEFGNVVGSSTNTTVLYNSFGQPNGLTASTSGLDLSGVYDGNYFIAVHNVQANGSWELIGAAPVTIYGNPPPIDDGGGGGCQPCPPDLQCLPCA